MSRTKFNRGLSLQRLGKKETMVIYSSESKGEKRGNRSRSIWKSPSKVKSGRFSRACRYSPAKKTVQCGAFFCTPFTSSLFCIFMISSWAVCSKGLGLVVCICLYFCRYSELQCERSIHRDVRAYLLFYVTISQGTLNNYFTQRSV